MDLQEELKQMAIENGLCEQWQREWGTPTLKELCEKYIKGLDFCIKHDYPSLQYLNEHFRGKTERYGIYINEEAYSWCQRNVVLNGKSRITVQTNTVTDITVRHESVVCVEAYDDAFVYVSLHDNSRLVINHKDENARICVSLFSGKIDNPELVDKIHDKNKK